MSDEKSGQSYSERLVKSIGVSVVHTTIGVASTPLAIVIEPAKSVIRIAQAVLGQENDTDK